MLDRLRNSTPVRRIAAVGSRFFDTFIRDNRVIPPVLALLALLVFAWAVAGLFVGTPDEQPASNRADLVQSEDPAPQQESPAPEIENRNVDSYAAYRYKPPFRELLAPAEAAEDTNGETTSPEETGDGRDGDGGGRGDGTGDDGRPRDGGGTAQDSDGDGISDEREEALGLDPSDPDTDGDGIPDGDEQRGGRGGDGRGGAGDRDLQESGGSGGRGDGSGGADGDRRRGGLPESGGSF